jgi:hypothetical protein
MRLFFRNATSDEDSSGSQSDPHMQEVLTII